MKATWKEHYSVVPQRLASLKKLAGVASVFNANIDAVLKLEPEKMVELMTEAGLSGDDIRAAKSGNIAGPAQLFKGLLDCFERGAAQEWLVDDAGIYAWMQDKLGYDHLQVGGQGGIIANVMAVCGVPKVYVHGASMPDQQTRLFLDLPNLVTTGADGKLTKAVDVHRDEEALIHWILEFDKQAKLNWQGFDLTCPKSNRFIATYDPLNFELHIDSPFDRALRDSENPLQLVLLSGYQMLGEKNLARVEESWKSIEAWKKNHPGCIVHFEFASTQDVVIRKALAEKLAPKVDSVGLNEQELIGALEVVGEEALAKRCEEDLHSVSLFEGLVALFKKVGAPRMQLHMFGLYVTLIKPGSDQTLLAQRDGMALAATVAAAKAGTGSIEKAENLLWAQGQEVADIALGELQALSDHLEKQGIAGLAENGIAKGSDYHVAALPTILIEKPVTLVGMGDTISSLSLAGAMVSEG